MIERSHPKSIPAQALVEGTPWTLIGPGSTVHGELLMAGNVLIHGRIEGVIFTDGDVRVAPGAWVEGGIHARRVEVEGALDGRVEAQEEVALRRGAVVRGDIETQVLTVDPGARFLGNWLRTEQPPGPRILPYENPPGNA